MKGVVLSVTGSDILTPPSQQACGTHPSEMLSCYIDFDVVCDEDAGLKLKVKTVTYFERFNDCTHEMK